MANVAKGEISFNKKNIISFLNNDNELLTLINKPLHGNKVLYDVIREAILKKNKVLYLFGGDRVDKDLLSYINKKEHYYTFTRDDLENKNLVFMNLKFLYNLNKKYDLIIIDDISNYLNITKNNFDILYERLKKHSKKIILYSSINYNNSDFMYINDEEILREPRVISTRIDLRYDIPYILYEYILWFKNNNKNVAIYVPYKEELDMVYEYYTKKVTLKGARILKGSDKKLKSNVLNLRDKSTFLITNNIEEVLDSSNINAIIVICADDKNIDYKKILFMCGKVSLKKDKFSEVILVCREESEEIEMSRKIAREFNKKLWEEEYLSY